jgi:hypothetical protein
MSPTEKRAFAFLLLGGITFLGLYWQYKLFFKDAKHFKEVKAHKSINKAPGRIKYGFWLCTLLIVGIIANGLIAIHVDHQPYTYAQIWQEVRTTLWFSVVFLIKSFFGPILTMVAAAIAAYYYLNYGLIANLPFVSAVMDFAASLAPDWLENIYTLAYLSYAMIMSFSDTVADT